MIINSTDIIYFSPTGTTKKILNSIVKGIGTEANKIIDLTFPNVRNEAMPSIEGDIALIGVPVYAGGIPDILVSFLAGLKGMNKPAVLIVVYGNMDEGIALDQLKSIAENSGFKVIAAASFIGEHSFSTEETPVAKGRPDCKDLNAAEEFGRSVVRKMQNIDNLNTSPDIPKGRLPIIAKILPKDSARIFSKVPSADMNLCSRCGLCVNLCPMGAINKETLKINEDECIRCFSCVKRCPKKARRIIYKPAFIVSKMLKVKSRTAGEPKIYL